VAFDEVESRLHPHAIRSLLATMREEVEARGLTVILTTHSPVVMNEFRDTPEQVFVLEPSPDHPTVPNALSVLHAEAWLAQAKLGTLYDQLAFAAPPVQVE
jgi:predicted ATPase